MGNTILFAQVAHGINLILHKGNKWRNNNGCSVHYKGGELVAEGLAAACGHKHKCVVASQQIADNSLLVSLECIKTKMDLKYFLQIYVFCHIKNYKASVLSLEIEKQS